MRPTVPLVVLLALALVAGVRGAPLPSPLPATPGAARSALASTPVEPDALGGACGSRLPAVTDLLVSRAASPASAPLPTPHSADVDGIAVLEDDGTFFYPDGGGHPVLDAAAVGRAFYRTHDDSVTFLAVYLASGLDQWLGSATALAAAWVLRNDIGGLGLSTFDYGASFGSAANLQAMLTMNGLHRYPQDPDEVWPGDTFNAMRVLAHEFGHRWLAYAWLDSAGTPSPALLGRDREHWNFFFDADSSVMEGCDWSAMGPDTFVTTGATTTFGALDQYLMGLRSKAETPPFFVVNDPTRIDPPGVYVPWSIPEVGVGCDGRATWWSADDLERLNGPRVPEAASAPHAWRVAFVLVTPRGQDATAADLAKLQAIRGRFPRFITEATGARGAVDVALPSRAGHLAIAHAPLADAESAALPRTFAARVTREAGAAPLAPGIPDVRLHWRAGAAGPFAEAPLVAVGPDSFAISLPAPPGLVQYWISATRAADGLEAHVPAAGALAPFAFTTGPDATPPDVQHSPVPVQAATRLPQVMLARAHDNLGLDAVWCEVSVDGAPATLLPATAAGHDSFTVSLGSGLGAGHRVAYRFVARDASAAGNLGYSNAAFDTMRIVRDHADDFENPSGYFHVAARWSYRDPWAPDTYRSSPDGGTAWHFGEPDGLPYGPHSDAVLYFPYVYAPVPGTTLWFDEWHDFEQMDDANAWDGCRLELQEVGMAAPVAVEPVPGYTHTMRSSSLTIPRDAACWSGASGGWVTRSIELGSWAPGPVRAAVRACADDWIGGGGLWIDHVRVTFPGGGTTGVPAGGADALRCGPAWPNPTRGELRLPLSLPRAARVDWALHDVQGRRIATLWRGPLEAGAQDLFARTPTTVRPGLYFSRVRVDDREVATTRIALVR